MFLGDILTSHYTGKTVNITYMLLLIYKPGKYRRVYKYLAGIYQ